MKTIYLSIVLCFFLTFTKAQNDNVKIVEDFIENFNKKDSIATFNFLDKDFAEYWQVSLVYKNKREYSKYFSWARIMKEYEEIEVLSTKKNKVIVNSTYYSDLDILLGKKPYKCKKTFVISNGKITKIITSKNKGYLAYQNKRKSDYIKFGNWLYANYNLKRQDFKLNQNHAIKMKKIIMNYISQNDIADR